MNTASHREQQPTVSPTIPRDKIVACICCWNEEQKIGDVLRRIPREHVGEIIVVDDGSTDQTAEVVRAAGATLLHHPPPRGVGSGIRQGIDYAKDQGAEIIIFMAGNNKDAPEEIPRLLQPILEDGYDVVQGSRYLPGGRHGGPMPKHRIVGTKFLHPWLFRLVSRRRMTDTTNGFRAFRLTLVDDPAIDLDQPWLNQYELEPYFLYTTIKLGYRITEVPVTKVYPPKQLGYTKMRPIVDWWLMVKPLVLLGLGLRR